MKISLPFLFANLGCILLGDFLATSGIGFWMAMFILAVYSIIAMKVVQRIKASKAERIRAKEL